MKNQLLNLTLIALLSFAFTSSSFAGIIPGSNAPKSSFDSYFENENIDFLIMDDAILEDLSLVSYNESNTYFSLKSVRDVHYVQILNSEGELEYQIPIKNSLLHISLSDFVPGDYYVNLQFDQDEEFISTMLTVK